jgi:hypothetical protein
VTMDFFQCLFSDSHDERVGEGVKWNQLCASSLELQLIPFHANKTY